MKPYFLLSLLFFFSIITIPASLLLAQTEPPQKTESPQIWEPQVAGRFYPASETALKDQIEGFLSKTPEQAFHGKPLAIIAPHAGYQFSGQVAAYGYSVIKNYEFNKVIILAPSHFMSGKRFRGVSILNVKHFKTPLGTMEVDRPACDYLLNNTNQNSSAEPSHKSLALFGCYEGAYKGEHSLEAQLPFLQKTLQSFKIIPMLVGILINDDLDRVADAIRPLIDNKTLIVISSDFTHYGEYYGYIPFKNNLEENIKKLDYGAFGKILSKDFEGLISYRKETGINACGIIPISLLLKLMPKEAQGTILTYDTSGHQSNNFSFSVSYASIIFTVASEAKSGMYVPKEKTPETVQPYGLSKKEKSALLSLARDTLESYVKTGTTGEAKLTEYSLTPRLKEKCGAFVTLKKHGELRGCIGHISPTSSLYQTIIENTINSSSKDGRFSAVKADEIPDITIEISVLSIPRKIDTPETFCVGKEGIILQKGLVRAVFLPQVATEQGWDRTETLCQLCKKAGLPQNAWKDSDTEFYIFTAEVFNERDAQDKKKL